MYVIWNGLLSLFNVLLLCGVGGKMAWQDDNSNNFLSCTIYTEILSNPLPPSPGMQTWVQLTSQTVLRSNLCSLSQDGDSGNPGELDFVKRMWVGIFLTFTAICRVGNLTWPPSWISWEDLAMSAGKYPEFEQVSVSKDGWRSRVLIFWKQKCFLCPSVLSFKFYKIFFLQL